MLAVFGFVCFDVVVVCFVVCDSLVIWEGVMRCRRRRYEVSMLDECFVGMDERVIRE